MTSGRAHVLPPIVRSNHKLDHPKRQVNQRHVEQCVLPTLLVAGFAEGVTEPTLPDEVEGKVEVGQEHPRHRQDRGDENELPREELAHGRVDRVVDHAREVHRRVKRLDVAHQRTFRLLGQVVLLCLDGLVPYLNRHGELADTDGFDVDQNPMLGLQMFGEGLEEPGVGVELPGVVLLPREDHMDRRQRDLVHLRRVEG